MANEIWHSRDEADTLYALIWRKTDDKVYDAAAASNTFDTYTDADILDYDVPLTNHADSDYHSADFPSDIAAGVYRVQILKQDGGAIDADADRVVGQGEMNWDGSAEITPFSLDTGIIPAGYVGDYREEDTVYLFWRTETVLSTAGTIKVYKDNNTGEVTAPTGITDTRDYDSKTGLHLVTIDLSVANSFYTRETDYIVVLSGAVVGGKTINSVLGTFSVENRYQGVKYSKHDG